MMNFINAFKIYHNSQQTHFTCIEIRLCLCNYLYLANKYYSVLYLHLLTDRINSMQVHVDCDQ